MKKFKVIAGPCVIESREHCLHMAKLIHREIEPFKDRVALYFKASFDKANRSSIDSYRGVKIEEACSIFESIRKEYDTPILTDVHTPEQVEQLGDSVDVLQIPAFLCRQTDLLLAAGKSQKIVNIKKGQFLAPQDMHYCVEKVHSTGNKKVWLTERGTTFGYNNLVVDMRSFPIMRKTSETQIIFDGTHSTQLPGGGKQSGGQREFLPHLVRAATAAGIDGLFLEVHNDPQKALSDSSTQLPIENFQELLRQCLAIQETLEKTPNDRRAPLRTSMKGIFRYFNPRARA